MMFSEQAIARAADSLRAAGSEDYELCQVMVNAITNVLDAAPMNNGAKVIALIAALAHEFEKTPAPALSVVVAGKLLREAMGDALKRGPQHD